MSLRTLLIILMLLNVIAFAGGRMGWLGDSSTRGEPERLTNQIRPDALELGTRAAPPASQPPAAVAQILPIASYNPAPPAPIHQPKPLHCAAYVVQGASHLAEATRLAEASDGQVRLTHETLEEASNWRVRIPPAPNQNAAEQRLKTLQARNITDVYLMRGEGPNQWSISLGLYSSQTGAQQRLTSLRAQGISNAEVVAGATTQYAVEFRGAANALEDVAAQIETRLGADARRACTP